MKNLFLLQLQRFEVVYHILDLKFENYTVVITNLSSLLKLKT